MDNITDTMRIDWLIRNASNKTPERIRINSDMTFEIFCPNKTRHLEGAWTDELEEGDIPFIRSTPLLEHAGEMRDALKYCVKALYDAVHRANVMNMPLYAGEAIQDAQYWLETIEKAEGEVNDANV